MSNALIVDDDASLVELMRAILRRAGYESFATTDSVKGLGMARRYHPDIIILNDMMPRMSGGELCSQIKRDPLLTKIPVIMVSAGDRVHDPAYIREIGADAVLSKPYFPKDLLSLIDRLLRRGPSN